MLSLFDTAKRILKSFFEDNLFSINNILSSTRIEAIVRAIDKGIKKDYDKVLKSAVELSNEKDNYEIVHFFVIRNTTRKKYERDDDE